MGRAEREAAAEAEAAGVPCWQQCVVCVLRVRGMEWGVSNWWCNISGCAQEVGNRKGLVLDVCIVFYLGCRRNRLCRGMQSASTLLQQMHNRRSTPPHHTAAAAAQHGSKDSGSFRDPITPPHHSSSPLAQSLTDGTRQRGSAALVQHTDIICLSGSRNRRSGMAVGFCPAGLILGTPPRSVCDLQVSVKSCSAAVETGST